MQTLRQEVADGTLQIKYNTILETFAKLFSKRIWEYAKVKSLLQSKISSINAGRKDRPTKRQSIKKNRLLKPKQVLNNRYPIQSILGEGGFGAVYQAVDSRLSVHCAVKENLQVSAESQKQFKREA